MTDFSHEARTIQITFCEELAIIRGALTAPSVLYRPSIVQDGDMWSVLLGDNIQEGICGFGSTPQEAMEDFDKAWIMQKTPLRLKLDREAVEQDRQDNSQFGVGA